MTKVGVTVGQIKAAPRAASVSMAFIPALDDGSPPTLAIVMFNEQDEIAMTVRLQFDKAEKIEETFAKNMELFRSAIN